MAYEHDDDLPTEPQRPGPSSMPKLFGEAEEVIEAGAGGGGEGVGGADDHDPGAGPRLDQEQDGWDDPEPEDELSGLLGGDSLGVRGARPASRRELAELILRNCLVDPIWDPRPSTATLARWPTLERGTAAAVMILT